MDNSRFSSLVYRIIGKPDRWHEDYIDVMHQILDETDAIDDPENFSELAIGDQILSRISNTNEALAALGALFDKSRFKMIVLDDSYNIIYHNQNAQDLYAYVRDNSDNNKLNVAVQKKVASASEKNKKAFNGGDRGRLYLVDYLDQNGEQLYLRSIHNHREGNNSLSTFYILMVVDQTAHTKELNFELIERYELTEKEQLVLIKLIHGESIKQISASAFISENTVKTHLKALYRKTGTKSQSDVVRLVLTDESQILDTYFSTNSGVITGGFLESAKDKFIYLETSQLKVAYREYGPANGHPIIVCHNGYGCRVTIPHGYEEMCQRQNKRIIIPDRPGFGLTTQVVGEPNAWSTMFPEFLDAMQIQSYDLLGTVLGSVIALDLAMEADARLKRVRLSSPVFVNTRKDCDYLTGIFVPVTRLIRASKRFALEIYELWLKSVTMNLSSHYRSMLENGLGVAEREQFLGDKTIDLMIEGFRQGSSKGLSGISHEMVHCLSPRNVNLSKINVPVDLWWGSEDNRITREGVENLADQLNDANLHIREGYSEYIYYALFEDIIS